MLPCRAESVKLSKVVGLWADGEVENCDDVSVNYFYIFTVYLHDFEKLSHLLSYLSKFNVLELQPNYFSNKL